MHRTLILAFMAVAALPARAQEANVSALLAEGWEVKGVMPTSAGPGILLQRGVELMMCFVAETPASVDIFTQYCKPVR